MSLYWNQLGERFMVNRAVVGGSVAGSSLDFKVHLYTNDYEYVDDDFDDSDFTEIDDATYTWYVPGDARFWNAATTNGSGNAECICTEVSTFTHDGAGGSITIYGYYLTISDGVIEMFTDEVVAFEPFASPITLTDAPDALTINLKLTLQDDND